MGDQQHDSADLLRRAAEVFREIVGQPEQDRADAVREMCAGDRRLQAEVLSLLEIDADVVSDPLATRRPGQAPAFDLITTNDNGHKCGSL